MVFADEPTGSLNSSASAGVLDLLEAVNRAGTTVVMVTPYSASRASKEPGSARASC